MTSRRTYWPVVGLLFLVAGCATDFFRPRANWASLLGTETTAAAAVPRESKALAGFLAGVLEERAGNHEEATRAFEKAVAADPKAPLLRKRLAVLYVRQGALVKALEQCRTAIDINPEDVELHLLLADVLSSLHREDEAIAEYQTVLSLDPQNQQALLLTGTTYAKQGRFGTAVETLKKLTQARPDTFLGYYYLGRVYAAAKQFDEAEAALRSAERLNPQSVPVQIDLALVFEAQHRDGEAMELYERALARSRHGQPMIHRRLGGLYAGHQRYDEALAQFRSLEKLEANPLDARTKIGLILLQKGDFEEAATEFSLVLASAPDDYRARFYLATAYAQLKAYRRAIREFGKIPVTDERFVDARMQIASLYQAQGRIGDAIKTLKKARRAKGDEKEFLSYQAMLHRDRKEIDKAVRILERLVHDYPDDDRLHFTLGALYDEKKDTAGCVEQMQRAIKINPKNAPALNYLGYTWTEQGVRLDEADSLIRRALKISPDDGYYVDSLGWIYYRRGDYEQAIHHLERALDLANDDPTIAEHLGDAYRDSGSSADALRAYSDALSRSTEAEQSERIQGKIEALHKAASHGGAF